MTATSYKRWLFKVNLIVEQKLGLSIDDFSERNWRYCYEDGLTPEEAVYEEIGSDVNDVQDALNKELF